MVSVSIVIFSGCACTLTVLTGRGSSRMESAPDLLHLFVQALALFATSLDRWFHVPRPTSVTLLFIPVVAIPDMVVCQFWGRVFPILCDYPTTKRGYCTRMVV